MTEWLRFLGLATVGVLAGFSFVIQQVVNTNLRVSLGSPYWAAFVSYFGGTLTMAAVLVVMHEHWISFTALDGGSWLSWTGGFFGAIYIVISILLLPRLGAATTVSLIVAGQMFASIAFDHLGVLGLQQHPIGLSRLIGAALLISGVAMLRS